MLVIQMSLIVKVKEGIGRWAESEYSLPSGGLTESLSQEASIWRSGKGGSGAIQAQIVAKEISQKFHFL
jgi:hypothetical protein